MSRTRTHGACLAVLMGALSLPAFAQEGLKDIEADTGPASGAPPAVAVDMWDWPSRVALGLQHRTEADVDNGSSVSAGGIRASIGAMHQLDEQWGVDVEGSFSRLAYDFSDTEAFGGMPWNDVNVISARGLVRARMDGQWLVLGGPIVAYSGETGAGQSAVSGGAGLGAIYTVSPELKVGLLLVAISRIEDSAAFLPAPLVHWSFAEQWSLRLATAPVAASVGYGAEVGYRHVPELNFGLGVQMQTARFRLDDAGVAPDGVGEDQSTLLYAQSTWQALDDLKVQLVAGLSAGGSLTVDDANGDELFSEDVDASLVVGARAVLTY